MTRWLIEFPGPIYLESDTRHGLKFTTDANKAIGYQLKSIAENYLSLLQNLGKVHKGKGIVTEHEFTNVTESQSPIKQK